MLRVLRCVAQLLRVILFLTFAAHSSAYCEEEAYQPGATAKTGPRFEVYSGAGCSERSIGLYRDAVWSIFGPVTEEGFRLRTSDVASAYGEAQASVFSSGFLLAGLNSVSSMMVGYQFDRGPLWLKLYGGVSRQLETKLLWQAGLQLQSEVWGGAAAVEAWWRLSDRLWASTDASWTGPENGRSAYARLAYDAVRLDNGLGLSLGVEASGGLNEARAFRLGKALSLDVGHFQGGGLIDLRYGHHELALTAGVGQTTDDAAWRPYAALSYGRKF